MQQNNRPIGERNTEETRYLQEKVEEYITENNVPISKIDVSINVTTPFPTLSGANQAKYLPIIDPHTMQHLVEENLSNENDEKIDRNVAILFGSQALKVIDQAFDSFIDILAAVLRDFYPRSKDFEKAFFKIIETKRAEIDSEIDSLEKKNKHKKIDEIFDEITQNLEKEEE